MSEARPADATLLRVQKAEIDRLNDNRVYLLGVIEEIKTEAENEIARLHEELSMAKARATGGSGSEAEEPTPGS